MFVTAALLAIATAHSAAADPSVAATPVLPNAAHQLTADDALACAAAHYRGENLARASVHATPWSSKGRGGMMPAGPHVARAKQMKSAGDAWRDHADSTLGRSEILAQYRGRACIALG